MTAISESFINGNLLKLFLAFFGKKMQQFTHFRNSYEDFFKKQRQKENEQKMSK